MIRGHLRVAMAMAAALVATIGAAGPVQAALMSYTYTGADFYTTVSDGLTRVSPNMANPCDPLLAGCAITHISAEIIIEDLGNDFGTGTLTTIAPLSWSISDGLSTITDADVTAGDWAFPATQPLAVTTDSSGVIDSWNFFVWATPFNSPTAGTVQELRTQDFSGLDPKDKAGYCQSYSTQCDTNGFARILAETAGSHIGSWTVSTVPVPAAAWLFGSALGLLGWLKRRTA